MRISVVEKDMPCWGVALICSEHLTGCCKICPVEARTGVMEDLLQPWTLTQWWQSALPSGSQSVYGIAIPIIGGVRVGFQAIRLTAFWLNPKNALLGRSLSGRGARLIAVLSM